MDEKRGGCKTSSMISRTWARMPSSTLNYPPIANSFNYFAILLKGCRLGFRSEP